MYACKTCGKKLQTKSGLIKHELSHTVTFKCDLCKKQYRRKSSLQKHEIDIHHMDNKQAEFVCRICRKVFLSAKDLKFHAKTHNQVGKGEHLSAMNGAAVVQTLRPRGIDRFDLVKFLSNIKSSVEKYLLNKVRRQAVKWYLVSEVELTREDREREIRTVEPYFRSVTYTLLSENDYDVHDLNEALQKMVIGLEKYIHESSGWVLKTVKKLDIHTVLYKPLGGSCFIALPKTLEKMHSILNVRNDDNKCFSWAILSSLHPTETNPYHVENYKPYEGELNMKGIMYPVALSKLNKFEQQNNDISLNVFGFENDEIYPLRITKQKTRRHHINLLFLQKNERSHYCLLKDLNSFLHRTKTSKWKTFFCVYCLQGFTRQDLLDKHIVFCSPNGEQKMYFLLKAQMTF